MKPKPKKPVVSYDSETDPEDLAAEIVDGLKKKAALRDMSTQERTEFYWELSRLAQECARDSIREQDSGNLEDEE